MIKNMKNNKLNKTTNKYKVKKMINKTMINKMNKTTNKYKLK